jgi:two-component system response regulator (stage 0 sporulation protein F)
MPKVLIVEDLQDVRSLLAIFLSKKGLAVIQAKSGEEGIDLVKQHKPDLVLLDAKLPGLDGIGVLKKIKEFDKNIKVIMLSGLSTEELKQEARMAGASDFLSKSLGIEEIVKAVSGMLY